MSGEVNETGWPDKATGERVRVQVSPALVVAMSPPGAATTQSKALTGSNQSAGVLCIGSACVSTTLAMCHVRPMSSDSSMTSREVPTDTGTMMVVPARLEMR